TVDVDVDSSIRSPKPDAEAARGAGFPRCGRLRLELAVARAVDLDAGPHGRALEERSDAVGHEVDGVAGAEDGADVADQQGRICDVERPRRRHGGAGCAAGVVAQGRNPVFMVAVPDGTTGGE